MMNTLALALCATLVSTAGLLIVAGGIGWQSFEEINENCFDNYLSEPNCFCERPRGEELGDVWIVQPANTASNIGFVIVGLWIAFCCDKEIPQRYWEGRNPFTRYPGYGMLLSTVTCFLGPGSAALHASLTSPGRRIDQFSMYLVGAFLAIYSATRKYPRLSFKAFFAIYMALILPLLVLTILSANTSLKRLMFSILIAITIACEAIHKLIINQYRKCFHNGESKAAVLDTANSWFMAFALCCLAFAYGMWVPSKSGGPLCFPDSWFQGHALWHVCTAIPIGCYFLYVVSANEKMSQDGDDEEPGSTSKVSIDLEKDGNCNDDILEFDNNNNNLHGTAVDSSISNTIEVTSATKIGT